MTTALTSSRYLNLGRQLPVFEAINTSSASSTLVTGVAGRRILVMSVSIGSSVNQGIEFLSGSTTIAAFRSPSNTTVPIGSSVGLFVTEDGEDLDLTLSSATLTTGHFSYIFV